MATPLAHEEHCKLYVWNAVTVLFANEYITPVVVIYSQYSYSPWL